MNTITKEELNSRFQDEEEVKKEIIIRKTVNELVCLFLNKQNSYRKYTMLTIGSCDEEYKYHKIIVEKLKEIFVDINITYDVTNDEMDYCDIYFDWN